MKTELQIAEEFLRKKIDVCLMQVEDYFDIELSKGGTNAKLVEKTISAFEKEIYAYLPCEKINTTRSENHFYILKYSISEKFHISFEIVDWQRDWKFYLTSTYTKKKRGINFIRNYPKIVKLLRDISSSYPIWEAECEKLLMENRRQAVLKKNEEMDQGLSQNRNSWQEDNDRSNCVTPEQLASEAAQLWEENDAAAETINAEIERAEQTNSWGTLGGNLVETIRASLVVQMDYRKMLSHFRATMLSSKRRLTRMRPSRRYGFIYMGSRHDFTTKLLVAVDVSGSVSSQSLVHFFSVINRFFKYGIESIDVTQFDHEIKGEPVSIKKAGREVKIIGRGGTCFQGAIDFYEEHSDYDGLIMFTDGYAPIPQTHRSGNNILWVFTSKSEYDAHTWAREMRGSRTTFIPARK